MVNEITWHRHSCPQCLATWECGAADCNPGWERFCPDGELCHVDETGAWKIQPKTIRQSRGVGSLFDPRGVPTVSRYQKGDQSSEIKRETK
jgi:hypothetical protein